MFQSPLRSAAFVCAGAAAILSQVPVLPGGRELFPALWADSHPRRVLPAGWIWVTVVPCRPAFFRAELLPAPPRILRKQATAVWADIRVKAKRTGFAVHNSPGGFSLLRGKRPCPFNLRKGDLKDFLNLRHVRS